MNFTNLFNWIRAAKIVAIASVCSAVLIVNSSPAFAFGIKGSAEPSQGTAQLDEVYKESKQVTKSQPRGMDEVADKASKGLNAVQGMADADKMKASGESEGATTVKEDIKDTLKSAIDG